MTIGEDYTLSSCKCRPILCHGTKKNANKLIDVAKMQKKKTGYINGFIGHRVQQLCGSYRAKSP